MSHYKEMQITLDMSKIKVGSSEGRIPDDEYTENVNEILANLDLMQTNVLTNAAMVLFAKKMPADYSQCFIRMGRFVDEPMDVVLRYTSFSRSQ